jgi:hypothetical protein
MLDDKKKPEQTQLNFNNSRSKIWDRNNLTKKKNQNISRSSKPNKSMSNDENENKNQFLKRIKKNKHKPG